MPRFRTLILPAVLTAGVGLLTAVLFPSPSRGLIAADGQTVEEARSAPAEQPDSVQPGSVQQAASNPPGSDFPQPFNSEHDKSSEPMPPAEAAARFKLPPGFTATVFAAEPEVQNPIAMTWDARGRLWIAENYTYAERTQQFELGLRDRVLIFEDADGDGKAEKRTVFTDQVQRLTSIEVGHGGVWLMCPPQLLFIPDDNHDDKADGPPQVVLDGFEVARENYHNFANGLRWGPDGWLYGRCGGSCPGRIGPPGTPDELRYALEGGLWRYHPKRHTVEVLNCGTTNPWGHDWDAFGEGFFVNTVNGHLWHLIPGSHLVRPFTLDPNSHTYELIDQHADHWHFDTGKKWSDSRDGAADEYGGGHAHCGTMIYLGGRWPAEYAGRLFTFNFHGRRANQEILERQGSGYVGHHGPDTMFAADPFFRGMELSYGPDGNVLLIDWSDTGECHENTGVHRTSGRIYKVSFQPKNSPRPPAGQVGVNLRDLSDAALVSLQTVTNEWYVRQARLILAERALQSDPASATVALLRMPLSESAPQNVALPETDRRILRSLNLDRLDLSDTENRALLQCRVLLTLIAMDAADEDLLLECLTHENEHIQTWAVRGLTEFWPIDDPYGPAPLTEAILGEIAEAVRRLETPLWKAAEADSGLVRLAIASTIQRLPVSLRADAVPIGDSSSRSISRRAQLAAKLSARTEDADDHNLPLLVWYGLMPVGDAAPADLVHVARVCQWPKLQTFIARRLTEEIERNPQSLDKLLTLASEPGFKFPAEVLGGMIDGLRGWRKARKPASWEKFTARLEEMNDDDLMREVRELSVVFGDGRALEEVRELVLDESVDIDVRRSALESLVANRAAGVKEIALQVLHDARLNTVAAQAVAFEDDPAAAKMLVDEYRAFRAPNRPQVISILVSRRSFAALLLDAIAAGRVPAKDLSAFDVRQIHSLGDTALSERVKEIWGETRETPAEKQQAMTALKAQLMPNDPQGHSQVDRTLQQGRLMFNTHCAKCHKLYGEGGAIGPDLTGSNRGNLDYLLENILDPSAVVSKDYRMSVIVLADGRVLNGVVVSKNKNTLTLQTQTEQQTIRLDEIEETAPTSLSPMPEGLLNSLSAEQVRALFAYLRHPAQVPLPAGAATE